MIDPLKIVELHINAIPFPIFQILEKLDLGPSFQTMNDDISGWIERVDQDRYRIAINKNHAHVRQRFTAAHELGHYIYHRDLLGRGVGDTRAYRADRTPFENAAIRPVHERQANSFAANILMPQKSISALRTQGISEPRELAAKLEVSEQAMRIRLGITA
ncbi:MAG: ImmA/IrrE family metallo-endopeptidase [Asticcacaulis sp.]